MFNCAVLIFLSLFLFVLGSGIALILEQSGGQGGPWSRMSFILPPPPPPSPSHSPVLPPLASLMMPFTFHAFRGFSAVKVILEWLWALSGCLWGILISTRDCIHRRKWSFYSQAYCSLHVTTDGKAQKKGSGHWFLRSKKSISTEAVCCGNWMPRCSLQTMKKHVKLYCSSLNLYRRRESLKTQRDGL